MSFNLPLARNLARYSYRAYNPLLSDDVITAPGTQATVLIDDAGDTIVLAFRGTHNIRDWLTDLKIEKTALATPCDPEKNFGSMVAAGPLRIHSGFLEAIDSVLPEIIARLLPAGSDKAKVRPIVTTGHSLGGALAALAAYFLAREGFNVQSVYTFASPRVGNAAWREAYTAALGSRTFRLVCSGDLVPLIPGVLTTFRDGYRHVGTEVLLVLGDGILIAPNHYLEIALDGWRAWCAIQRGDVDFLLSFHSIEGDYIPCLQYGTQIAL